MIIAFSIILLVIIFVLYLYISIKVEIKYNIVCITAVVFILGGFYGLGLCILAAQLDNKFLYTDTDCKKVIFEIHSVDTIQQDTVVILKNN